MSAGERGTPGIRLDLARAARGGRLISLANSGPVVHRNQIVVIHDAQVFRRPDFFSRSYLTLHRTLGYLLARRASIATVSDFSRRELADALRLAPAAIPVFSNSAEHFAATVPDFSVIERLGLVPNQFFLSVGSMTKNKNISLAIQAAKQLGRPDIPLVVVGGDNNKVFSGGPTAGEAGVVLAGPPHRSRNRRTLFARRPRSCSPASMKDSACLLWRQCCLVARSLPQPRTPCAKPAATPLPISTRSTPGNFAGECARELRREQFLTTSDADSNCAWRCIHGENRRTTCCAFFATPRRKTRADEGRTHLGPKIAATANVKSDEIFAAARMKRMNVCRSDRTEL